MNLSAASSQVELALAGRSSTDAGQLGRRAKGASRWLDFAETLAIRKRRMGGSSSKAKEAKEKEKRVELLAQPFAPAPRRVRGVVDGHAPGIEPAAAEKVVHARSGPHGGRRISNCASLVSIHTQKSSASGKAARPIS